MNELTERERRILTLIQQGLTNYQIAVVGKLSPTIVYKDIRSIKDKLGVNSKEALMILVCQEKGVARANSNDCSRSTQVEQ